MTTRLILAILTGGSLYLATCEQILLSIPPALQSHLFEAAES